MDSLAYCSAKKGLEVYASCIMTNHVHLIIGTHDKRIELYTPEVIFKYLDYIHDNPVKAGLVAGP